ncbi:unnamed protein product [Dimorphilus gyrociliatus]|uniref:NACHT domain-containing protein n=1 Tax=Dimorphilus gyrociliatus TaxID=2664684 RepID=A0A7I8WE54_9ANNE|nr:unnamed protein product [Dimorphilus gyrociliatus]
MNLHNLSSNEKLSLNYYKENIKDLLKAPSAFYRLSTKLDYLKILNTDDKHELQKQYDGGQKNLAISSIFESLFQLNFCDIWEIFFDMDNLNCERLAKCLHNREIAWQQLIFDTKIQRQKQFTTIPLLPFTKFEVKISDIITSIEISEVRKVDIIDWELQKTEFDYQNFYKIFYTEFKKILIQGKPGIGKSVQVKYLLYKWANEQWKVDSQKLCLFIILRKVKQDSSIYQEIIEQNFKNIPYINENIVESMFIEKRNDVVLFLDGADELYQANHPLYTFLEDPICNIQTVIWSRKWRAKELNCKCDIVFELTGWNPFQMTSFFRKCFNEEDIEKSLEFQESVVLKNQKINSLCNIPLLAMILFHVWKEKEESFYDKSLYENYQDIINIAQAKHGCIAINNDAELQTFYELCLRNLSQNKILLDDKNLIELIETNFKCILQIIPLPTNQVELQFYHLSFQEFFAAKFLITKVQEVTKKKRFFLCEFFFSSKNSMNSLFEGLTNVNLFNVMEFIQHYSSDVFQKILIHFKVAKNMFDFSNNLMNFLQNGLETDNVLELQNETLSDDILKIIFIKFGKNLEKIILIDTFVNLKLMIDCCCKYCTKLRSVTVKGSEVTYNNEILTEDLFLENIFHSQIIKYLERIEIGNQFLAVKENSFFGNLFGYFCRFTIIYSSKYITEFIDESFDSKNYFTNIKIKFFDGLTLLKRLVIGNKKFGGIGQKRFLSMIEKKLQNKPFRKFESYNCEIINLDINILDKYHTLITNQYFQTPIGGKKHNEEFPNGYISLKIESKSLLTITYSNQKKRIVWYSVIKNLFSTVIFIHQMAT